MALVGAATLIALAVVEVATRWLDLAPDVKSLAVDDAASVYRRSSNPLLAFELKADYRNPDPDYSTSYPFTNSWGQRDVERDVARRTGARRILLLGDSVVEGHKIVDFEQTISRQLERLYADGTEVLNFGVSGYSTAAEVELLDVKGLRFRPDAVVLVFVGNDYDNFSREALALGPAAERAPIVEWLFLRSDLFRLTCTRWNLFHFGVESDPLRWNTRAMGDNNVADGLERLHGLSERHGFDVLVAIWPLFRDDDVVDVHPMPQAPDRLIVEQLAGLAALRAVRLSDAFRRDMEAAGGQVNPRLRYTIGDGLHPSPEGCRVAAAAIHAAMAAPPAAPPAADRAALDAARELGQRNRPDYSRVHNNAGLALKNEGRIEAAIEEFARALEIDPDLADAHNNMGNALRSLGRVDEAIDHYRRGLRVDPDNGELHANLAKALASENRQEEAEPHFRAALTRQPGTLATRIGLANTLIALERYGEAIPAYVDALELDPGNPGLHGNLGNALAADGRMDEALEQFEEALRLDPGYAPAHRGAGKILALRGELDQAIEHLEAALRAEPRHAETHTLLAGLLSRTGRPAEARRHMDAANRADDRP